MLSSSATGEAPPPPPPRATRRSLPLSAVLSDPLLKRAFMKFSVAHCCAENVEFYQEVDKYKGFDNVDVQQKYAETIEAVFLDPDSSLAIYIPCTAKDTIASKLKKGEYTRDLFDAAQQEIAALMATDALPRFLRSEEFIKVVEAQEEQYKSFNKSAASGVPDTSNLESVFNGLSKVVPKNVYAPREEPSSRRSIAMKGRQLLQALRGDVGPITQDDAEGTSASPEKHARKFSGNSSNSIRKQLRGIRSWARHRKHHHHKHELVSMVDVDAEAIHTDDESDAVARYANFTRFPIVKEGFLRKMSTSVRKDWKRRWFILRGRCLWYVRDASCANMLEDSTEEGQLSDPVFVCECAISAVKEVRDAGKLEHVFEIISPNRRTFLLQASSPGELAEWLDAMRSGIENALSLPEGKSSIVKDPDVEVIRGMSPVCADCSSQTPEWFSLSCGVLLCIECSGVHRSLGTHISKVRSITLDKPTASVKALLKALGGNERVNASVWEAMLEKQTGWTRPKSTDSREAKTAYIKSKYQWRGFCHSPDAGADDALFLAAVNNDVLGVLKAISTGARIGSINSATKRTALHAAAHAGGVEACELLLQNGAHACISSRDANGLTPTDLALVGEHVDVLNLLVSRGE